MIDYTKSDALNVEALLAIIDEIEIVASNIIFIQKAYENALISVKARDIAIEKAQIALNSASQANLSALFAGERAEYVAEQIDFLKSSLLEIRDIKKTLLENAKKVENAKIEIIRYVTVSIAKAIESRKYRDESLSNKNIVVDLTQKAKNYRDESLNNKNIVVDLTQKTANYKDEAIKAKDRSEAIYKELKDVGSVYDIKKEIYTLRTGTIYERRIDE